MGAWVKRRKLLLLDLDNTLYDWVAYFAPAFRGLCRSLSEISGLSSDTLFDEFKAVFARHGTVEYSFALQELPSVLAIHPEDSGVELVARYRAAIDVFQHRRRAYLRTYPGVRSGIEALHEVGYEVFGVTDSRRFQAENRLRQLRLDRLLDGICCVADHELPDAETVAAIRRKSDDHYTSELRTVLVLPAGLRKPSPRVLDFVVASLRVDYEACIYVGDSLSKDIAMAQIAGIYDCWAEYGAKISPLDFATLVRVTDWPRAAVRGALNPSPERLRIFPSFSAMSFEEIVALALMDPQERPRRHMMNQVPRQLSLLEFGPVLSKAQAR